MHLGLGSGMKIHGCSLFVFVRVQYFTKNLCSCSFVFDIFEKKRVRVRSCSVFSKKLRVYVLFAFMFVFGFMKL